MFKLPHNCPYLTLTNNAQNSPSKLQQYIHQEFPDVQADLEKAEGPEIKLPTSAGP